MGETKIWPLCVPLGSADVAQPNRVEEHSGGGLDLALVIAAQPRRLRH